MRLLFVCVGNSCRSQMAEGIARHLGHEAAVLVHILHIKSQQMRSRFWIQKALRPMDLNQNRLICSRQKISTWSSPWVVAFLVLQCGLMRIGDWTIRSDNHWMYSKQQQRKLNADSRFCNHSSSIISPSPNKSMYMLLTVLVRPSPS